MTVAAAQAQQFYKQVASEKNVFTFLDDGSYLVFKVRDVEVVPFWSSSMHLGRVQKAHPKYRNYTRDEIPLHTFLAETLPRLREEKISVGVNWSGTRLTGYDIPASDLEVNLRYWLSKTTALTVGAAFRFGIYQRRLCAMHGSCEHVGKRTCE